MYHLAASNIHSHMVDPPVAAGVEDQIARPHLAGLNSLAHLSLGAGVMRQGHAKMFHHLHGKAGTVRAVGQAGSSPYIGVAYNLKGVVDDLGTT